MIAGVAGALVSTAFLGGASNIWDVEENPSVSENNSESYIWDKAGILSDEDHIALILQIQDVVKKHNCGIYIVTISSASNSGYSDALDAAQKMYSELKLGIGSDHDGVLLLMSDEDRYFAIVSFGDYAATIFNNDEIEYLQNISVPYFRNDDWYGGLSAYVSAASELLDGIRPSADMSLTISDFIGDYTYDASFENPDGTWTNFLYSLSVKPGNDGVLISEVWRGIYSFCDDWASQDDLDGNTLYFVIKYGDNAGTHSLTYIPAAQSTYGSDTIYVDGNTDMPFTKDGYIDNSYSYWDDSYSDSYILPTDTQYITESDLYGMSKEQASLARNEIYARYGYSFKNADIRSYFMQQSWYYENPSVNADTFGISNLSDCERANLETIQQYERDMGWK